MKFKFLQRFFLPVVPNIRNGGSRSKIRKRYAPALQHGNQLLVPVIT